MIMVLSCCDLLTVLTNNPLMAFISMSWLMGKLEENATIFARNYGTAAVISYNLKGIAPPVPPVQCWIDKTLMSGCEAPTLKRVGGGRVGKMYP